MLTGEVKLILKSVPQPNFINETVVRGEDRIVEEVGYMASPHHNTHKFKVNVRGCLPLTAPPKKIPNPWPCCFPLEDWFKCHMSSTSQVKLPDKYITKNQQCFPPSFYCGLCPLIGLSPLPASARLVTRPPCSPWNSISRPPGWNVPGFLSCILLCLSSAQMLTCQKSNALGVLG